MKHQQDILEKPPNFVRFCFLVFFLCVLTFPWVLCKASSLIHVFYESKDERKVKGKSDVEDGKWGEVLSEKMSFFLLHIWVFPKIQVPQNGWFRMENPIKMDVLGGNPYFWKHPYMEIYQA